MLLDVCPDIIFANYTSNALKLSTDILLNKEILIFFVSVHFAPVASGNGEAESAFSCDLFLSKEVSLAFDGIPDLHMVILKVSTEYVGCVALWNSIS